jgi:hypothetical protein
MPVVRVSGFDYTPDMGMTVVGIGQPRVRLVPLENN